MTMSDALPMFPLGSVLLPGAVLPLHVFEPRYRALIGDCLHQDVPAFGVVLIAQGSEVGGQDVRTDVGTRARIVQVAELGDGRFAVVAVGAERFRVTRWLPDDPYPRAEVEEWPDVPDFESDADQLGRLADQVTARVRRATALALELGDPVVDPGSTIDGDPTVASYQLAIMAPVGPLDRQQILMAPHARGRLETLAHLLDDVEALLQFRLDSAPG